jgi:hypothetical protein
VFRPSIADILDEEHHQQIVFVLTSIDSPTEGIASPPENIIDLILTNWENRGCSFVHEESMLAFLAFSHIPSGFRGFSG